MFRSIKILPRLLEAVVAALESLRVAVHALPTAGTPDLELERRVAALERELERRHAEAEGLLLKAQGKYDAARAAEERSRRLANASGSSEDGEEGLDEEAIFRAYEEAGIPFGNGEAGAEEGVPPVHSRMERRRESKSNAYAMKFGR